MFDVKIPLYGICILISFVLGLFVVYINTKVIKLKKSEAFGLLFYILLGALFGAKYYSFLSNPERYDGIFEFEKLGLSSYGAVIGILILLFIFSKQFKKSFKDLIYIMIPSIPLMYGVGKIGCFLSGCCHGIEYDGLFNVIYNYSLNAPKGISLFPVQLLEAIIFILIFGYVFYIMKKKQDKDLVLAKAFILCGFAKFILDYLRFSHVNIFLSSNQLVSILFILIGLFLIIKKRYKSYKKAE